jgi:hypothetical protein
VALKRITVATTMTAPTICSGVSASPSAAQAIAATATGSRLRTIEVCTAPRRGSSRKSPVIPSA